MSIYTKKLTMPTGNVIVGADDNGICLFDYEDRRMMDRIRQRIINHLHKDIMEGHYPFHDLLEVQLDDYF